MFLHDWHGLSYISLKMFSTNSAINNILYGEVNFLPIAVTRFCFEVFSFKVKIFSLRTTSASSTSFEIVTFFSCLKSSLSSRAERPPSWEMLGYEPTISTVRKSISSVKFGKEFFQKIISILLPRPKLENESHKKKICFRYNNRSLKN